MNLPKKLSLQQEIDIYTFIARNCVVLAEWYGKVDKENLQKVRQAAQLLQSALDSRVNKIDPTLRIGLE